MTDLERLKEQRDYERTRGEDKVEGRLWYRNCRSGCPVFEAFASGFGSEQATRNGCNECTLLAGPCYESQAAEMAWMLPDASLALSSRPHWFVAAVSYLRVVNRAGM